MFSKEFHLGSDSTIVQIVEIFALSSRLLLGHNEEMAELNLLPKKEYSPGCQQPSVFRFSGFPVFRFSGFLVLDLSVARQAQVVPVELLVLVCHSVDGTVSAK